MPIKTLTSIATAAMKPLAKAGGFKKKELTWRRRHGETVQVLNVQRSHGNTASEASCYVNVAIAFDALYRLEKQPVPDAPREHECHFRERMEHLVVGAPSEWSKGRPAGHRHSKPAEKGAALVPVRVSERPAAAAAGAGLQQVALVPPSGWRVEGLSVETAAQLLGRLGC